MDPRAEASIAIKNELLCQFLEMELQCEQMRALRIHGKVGLDGFSASDRYRNTLALIEAIGPRKDSGPDNESSDDSCTDEVVARQVNVV